MVDPIPPTPPLQKPMHLEQLVNAYQVMMDIRLAVMAAARDQLSPSPSLDFEDAIKSLEYAICQAVQKEKALWIP